MPQIYPLPQDTRCPRGKIYFPGMDPEFAEWAERLKTHKDADVQGWWHGVLQSIEYWITKEKKRALTEKEAAHLERERRLERVLAAELESRGIPAKPWF